jgi:hypothetical protein
MRKMSRAYKILVEKLEGKSLLGRNGHRWKDNIKMILNKWYMRIWN